MVRVRQVVAAALLALPLVVSAEEFGTAKEAEALAQKAVKHVGSVGRDKAVTDFNQKKADWVDRDLYVVVLDNGGKVLAHSVNEKLVGKDMLEVKDVDGKFFTRDCIETVKAKGKGWIDYKFTDPVSKKILPKSAYCEKAGDAAVLVGIYKR